MMGSNPDGQRVDFCPADKFCRILRFCIRISFNELSPADNPKLVRAAQAGDTDAIGLIKESGFYLGRAIAQAGNLFAPQKIILSGQLVQAGNLLFDALQTQINSECLPAISNHMEIMPSPFGDDIGALGAAALVLENEFNPIASNTTLL